MLNEKFYIQLKKFLKRQGITQAEIAERYGTTQAYINLLLNCKTPIGHSYGNSTTAIYIDASLDKVDKANRRVINAVLAQKPDGEIL